MITKTPLHVIGARVDLGLTGLGETAFLTTGPDGVRLESCHEEPTDRYISPGWVDLHAHVYDGFTTLSVHPDVAGYRSGVVLVADAGSAGEATVDGLSRYVVPTARTAVRAWLNIGSHGLVHLREVADLDWVNVDRALEAIGRRRSYVASRSALAAPSSAATGYSRCNWLAWSPALPVFHSWSTLAKLHRWSTRSFTFWGRVT
jgi:dihydroorotase